MYTSFFGLNEKPFSIAPDPRYLFMSERHTEALAHLIYGVRESGGFIQLTGEVGTGKTTLIRSLLQQLPDTSNVALILNPQLSRNEFLSTICEELGVRLPKAEHSAKTCISALNTYLLSNHSKGRRTILIVDEAQNLRPDVLEQVRLLTNLETTKQKLLQILLIGQPELRELLSRTSMRQLAQRITGRYHLEPLSRDETETYIDHRLKVAGGIGQIFSTASKREVYRLSEGVPRRINVIADRAMLGAFTQEKREVDPQLVRQAAAEVLDRRTSSFSPWRRWLKGLSVAAIAIAVLLGVGWAWTEFSKRPEPAAVKLTAPLPAAVEAEAPDPEATGTEAAGAEAAGPEASADDEATSRGVAAAARAASETGVESRLDPILRENYGATTMADAFATLFGFWGASYVPGPTTACAQAERLNLYCLFQTGTLAQIRSLDRPVILTLQDPAGQRHRIVLSRIADETVTLSIAGENFQVSRTELDKYWSGEYLLLWRPEIAQSRTLAPGMRGDGIVWLRKSLAEIQGEPVAPADSDFFDSALEARVRSYQREKRLGVDGVVGYQTQIAINSDLSSPNRPSLTRVN